MNYEENIDSRNKLWQERLKQCDKTEFPNDPSVEHARDHYFEEREVGVRHPDNQSMMKITDEGYIDLFAGPNLGIRIDPITNSINIFGDQINLLGKTINIKTKPNEFLWNGYHFNPQLYFESESERAQTISGTKEYYHQSAEHGLAWHQHPWSIRPMVQHSRKKRYSEGMIDILKNLGLPAE